MFFYGFGGILMVFMQLSVWLLLWYSQLKENVYKQPDSEIYTQTGQISHLPERGEALLNEIKCEEVIGIRNMQYMCYFTYINFQQATVRRG